MAKVDVFFDPPEKLLSLNDRLHWAKKNRISQAWRDAAGWAALAANPHPLRRCTVRVVLPVRTAHKRDPHNYVATVKPIIDGLVDAGWWPDDNSDWVTVLEPELCTGMKVVHVTAIEVEP